VRTETLYKSRTPHATEWREQFFELTMGEQTVDGQLGYFVRETQCWWDVTAKRTVRVQYTLSPREGFATIEEANERYKLQRRSRAQRGFVHSFIPCYETNKVTKYVRIEIEKETKISEEEA
jgi:uncharacterized protein YpbB